LKIDGACQCGAISFEAEVDPHKVTICHCSDCQHFSGSPWRASVPALAADFRITSGCPSTYVKTAESGAKRLQAFCGTCGTSIYATSPDNPAVYGIRLGSVNQRAQLSPRKQIWTRSALPWAADIRELPASPEEWK
jgi:hypothetical protein